MKDAAGSTRELGISRGETSSDGSIHCGQHPVDTDRPSGQRFLHLLGELFGDVLGVIGSASVRIRDLQDAIRLAFVRVRRVFVGEQGWPQNPAAYGLTSSSLVPGIPYLLTTYSESLGRPPRFSPPPTGKNTGKSLQIPDIYSDRKILSVGMWWA